MNSENRNQIIIFAVLIVVLAGVFYNFVLKPGGAGAGPGNGASGRQEQTEIGTITEKIESAFRQDEIDIPELLANIQDVRFDYKAVHEARNPMRPLVGSAVLTSAGIQDTDTPGSYTDEDLLYIVSAMSFTGVIWDKEIPLAILDNELVYQGYEFGSLGIIVTDISADSVVLMVPLSDGPIEHVQRLKEPEAYE